MLVASTKLEYCAKASRSILIPHAQALEFNWDVGLLSLLLLSPSRIAFAFLAIVIVAVVVALWPKSCPVRVSPGSESSWFPARHSARMLRHQQRVFGGPSTGQNCSSGVGLGLPSSLSEQRLSSIWTAPLLLADNFMNHTNSTEWKGTNGSGCSSRGLEDLNATKVWSCTLVLLPLDAFLLFRICSFRQRQLELLIVV